MEGDADSGDEGSPGLYRLDSNQSRPSVFEDVEMAHDEVCQFSKNALLV
jgi:hypothetical protein